MHNLTYIRTYIYIHISTYGIDIYIRVNRDITTMCTHLCREATVTNGAFERPLLRVTPIVYLQCGVTRKRFVADITRCVATYCNRACQSSVNIMGLYALRLFNIYFIFYSMTRACVEAVFDKVLFTRVMCSFN